MCLTADISQTQMSVADTWRVSENQQTRIKSKDPPFELCVTFQPTLEHLRQLQRNGLTVLPVTVLSIETQETKIENKDALTNGQVSETLDQEGDSESENE